MIFRNIVHLGDVKFQNGWNFILFQQNIRHVRLKFHFFQESEFSHYSPKINKSVNNKNYKNINAWNDWKFIFWRNLKCIMFVKFHIYFESEISHVYIMHMKFHILQTIQVAFKHEISHAWYMLNWHMFHNNNNK